MAQTRSGERWGWILGWLGSFLWMPILGTVIMIQRGVSWQVYCTFACSLAALAAVFYFAPWRHPAVRMWKLMLPMYLLLFSGAGCLLLVYEEVGNRQLLAMLPGVIPILMPLLFIGRKSWLDQEPHTDD